MKSIKLSFFTTLEFDDSDSNYDSIIKIKKLLHNNIIEKSDFDIICSMFELHKKLPPVAKVLYDKGFILPKNEVIRGLSHEAVWKYERANEPLKTLKYSDRYYETTAHKSDRYYKNSVYTLGDLTAKYEYSVLMFNYGKIKKNQKICIIKDKEEIIFEQKLNHETQ